MKTLQPINTILLTLVLLVAGIAGFAPQAAACTNCEFALYTDERPSGTGAQGLARGTWTVRSINKTVIEQGSSISRSGNDITLQPGTYYIHLVAGIYSAHVETSKLRLLRTTDNQTLAIGHSVRTDLGDSGELLAYITVPSETTFRIEHFANWSLTQYPAYGGHPVGGGEPEVYLTIRIVKVTDDKCH